MIKICELANLDGQLYVTQTWVKQEIKHALSHKKVYEIQELSIEQLHNKIVEIGCKESDIVIVKGGTAIGVYIISEEMKCYNINPESKKQYEVKDDVQQKNYCVVIKELNEQGLIHIVTPMIPVFILTNKGNYYPIEKQTLYYSNECYKIDPSAYLAYDNSQFFEGQWKVYLAGGIIQQGLNIVISKEQPKNPTEGMIWITPVL